MREIVFRGKTPEGKWVYGTPFFLDGEPFAFIINNCQSLNFTNKDTSFQTETEMFQKLIFPQSLLFIAGRLTFYDVKGVKAKANGGAPSVLISYSEFDSDSINDSGIGGHHLLVNALPVITITQSPDWKSVVSISLVKLNGRGSLDQIYSMVERIAPDKVNRNKFYKEKIRQKLQKYFYRIDKGVYQESEVSNG